MEDRERINVAVHAPARAFADGAQTGLTRLGYNLLSPRTAAGQGADDPLRPALQIVDDRQLDDAPIDPALPLVILTGHRGEVTTDARAVGCIRRRAQVHELYSVLQDALEPVPRAVPRVPDAIPARCRRGDRTWIGAIRSISERGCLLQSTSDLEPDLRVDLSFPIHPGGWIQVPAQPFYKGDSGVGLVFRETRDKTQMALRDYVAHRLST